MLELMLTGCMKRLHNLAKRLLCQTQLFRVQLCQVLFSTVSQRQAAAPMVEAMMQAQTPWLSCSLGGDSQIRHHGGLVQRRCCAYCPALLPHVVSDAC